jgi:hypothetical protein
MASAKTGANVAFIGNADKTKTHSMSTKKVSAQEQQYKEAIAMSSAELGAAIMAPTDRITKHIGSALAHEEIAKNERVEALREFNENIAYYYEVKQRLLNPGYRTDRDGGKDRTPDDNQRNFGAPDWATFNEQCAAYSLQHADRLLKQFAKANGLLTDDGENIDDPEDGEVGPAGSGRRNTKDVTAQRRYEHIASAAVEIASRNPEGEVEKQILAAAAHEPAPLMPVPPDVYTEVLGFVTRISSSATDAEVKADAKRLVGKLLLHKPAPDPTKILADTTPEEKRKRNKRLAKKNGQPLGSMAYNPPTSQTSEHVQGLAMTPNAGAETIPVACGSADSKECTSRPPSDAERSDLKVGKRYQVRPAPQGGYGVYEPGSPVLLRWYETEEEARDSID